MLSSLFLRILVYCRSSRLRYWRGSHGGSSIVVVIVSLVRDGVRRTSGVARRIVDSLGGPIGAVGNTSGRAGITSNAICKAGGTGVVGLASYRGCCWNIRALCTAY